MAGSLRTPLWTRSSSPGSVRLGPRCWGAASQPRSAMAFLPHLAVRLGCVRPGLDTQPGCSDLQADLVCFVACCRTAGEAVGCRASTAAKTAAMGVASYRRRTTGLEHRPRRRPLLHRSGLSVHNYGSEGWGFESLRDTSETPPSAPRSTACTCWRPYFRVWWPPRVRPGARRVPGRPRNAGGTRNRGLLKNQMLENRQADTTIATEPTPKAHLATGDLV